MMQVKPIASHEESQTLEICSWRNVKFHPGETRPNSQGRERAYHTRSPCFRGLFSPLYPDSQYNSGKRLEQKSVGKESLPLLFQIHFYSLPISAEIMNSEQNYSIVGRVLAWHTQVRSLASLQSPKTTRSNWIYPCQLQKVKKKKHEINQTCLLLWQQVATMYRDIVAGAGLPREHRC